MAYKYVVLAKKWHLLSFSLVFFVFLGISRQVRERACVMTARRRIVFVTRLIFLVHSRNCAAYNEGFVISNNTSHEIELASL